MRKVAFVFALAACSRANPTNDVVLVTPPPVPPSASVAPMASALPVTPASKPALDLVVVGGDLVDLGSMAVLHSLTTDLVFTSAVGGDTAYLWTRPGTGGNEFRAYDVKSGKLRWSKPAVECWAVAASSAGGFCGSSAGVRWFRKADGADTMVAGFSTSALVTLGGRVLALGDTTLQAFDDAGATLGKTSTPVPADRNFARTPLEIAGTLACGSQRSDAATTVFCVDSSPRVVWSRRVPVPGGLLRQADRDVLVVTSDTWSKTPASEVVRTSDGTALLHAPGLRLAAALTTAGVFDGALTSEPLVSLYDAKGIRKWTWKGPPFHDEALRAVRSGSNIVIAQYSPIATGTQLRALDEPTGSLAWTGNVDSLPIAHSKYSNEVTLELRGAKLLLRGVESSQDYAQTFDPATGVRAVSVLRKR